MGLEYEQVEEQLDKYKKDASANIKPKPEPSPTVSAANDLQFMIPEYRNRLEINDTEDTCVEFLEYPRLGPEDFRYAMDKTYRYEPYWIFFFCCIGGLVSSLQEPKRGEADTIWTVFFFWAVPQEYHKKIQASQR